MTSLGAVPQRSAGEHSRLSRLSRSPPQRCRGREMPAAALSEASAVSGSSAGGSVVGVPGATALGGPIRTVLAPPPPAEGSGAECGASGLHPAALRDRKETSRREQLEAWQREKATRREQERQEQRVLRALSSHNERVNAARRPPAGKPPPPVQEKPQVAKAPPPPRAAPMHVVVSLGAPAGGARAAATGGAASAAPSAHHAQSHQARRDDADRAQDGEALLHLLKSHNAKFKKERIHRDKRTTSVKAVRKWEAQSGRNFASLSVEERLQAHEEIANMAQSVGV